MCGNHLHNSEQRTYGCSYDSLVYRKRWFTNLFLVRLCFTVDAVLESAQRMPYPLSSLLYFFKNASEDDTLVNNVVTFEKLFLKRLKL